MPVFFHDVGCQCNNGQGRVKYDVAFVAPCANQLGGFHAIHFRHAHVHEYHVVASHAQGAQGFKAIFGKINVVPHALDEFAHDELVGLAIFGAQNGQAVAMAAAGDGFHDFRLRALLQRQAETKSRASA